MHDPLRQRRLLLTALPLMGGLLSAAARSAAAEAFAAARADYRIAFPRDHGSHPQFRIEWWYVTGWLHAAREPDCGFQITFFRARPRPQPDNPSRFRAEQVIIAHAAIADPRQQRLVHVQRAAREGFGLAGSDRGDTRVWVDDWQLVRDGGRYRGLIATPELGLSLVMAPAQPPLLQGVGGFSRKGPRPESASHYYSIPQLQVSGKIRLGQSSRAVDGKAWLDHEWSSSYLEPDAAGWDWIGINLDDGSALMAFRIRARKGGVLWAGGAWRDAGGRVRNFAPGEVEFEPLREWRSPRTGITYPVAFSVRAGPLALRIEPLMEDQENDTRMTTGAVYWEGAVRASDGERGYGRGYLELTGYGSPLQL
jgi:predicted secreted hydrolase